MPKLSIAIPFYSNIALLKQALLSAMAQTEREIEIIVCDDVGPEDGVEAVISGLGDSRIKYYRNSRNLGLAGNWNNCLDRASAELVTLLHADDELCPEYASLMVEQAKVYPDSAALFCRADVINLAGEKFFSFPDHVKRYISPSNTQPFTLAGDPGLARLLRGQFIFCPSLCYRMTKIGSRRFTGQWKQVLDLEFLARLLLEGDTLVGLPQAAYRYRRHGGNQTAKQTEDLSRFREEISIYSDLADRAGRQGWQQAMRIAGKKTIIKLHLAYVGASKLVTAQFRSAVNVFKLLRST